jgi:hypothetical protein
MLQNPPRNPVGKPLNRSSNLPAKWRTNPLSKQSLRHALHLMGPTLTALVFAGVGSGVAHAQGTMDFSGAQTLMQTFNTIALFADVLGLTCTRGTPNACTGQRTGTAYFNTGWNSVNTNVASISGSNTYHSVNLLGVSPGTSLVNGHISSEYCSSGGGGTATVQTPYQLFVESDVTSSVTCPVTSVGRTVTYQIQTSSSTPMVLPIQIRENVPSNTTSSSNNSTVSTGQACNYNNVYEPGVNNEFNGYLYAGCPASVSITPCGFTFSNQQWQWCPAGSSNTSIGTIGPNNVQNYSITVDGNNLPWTNHTFGP